MLLFKLAGVAFVGAVFSLALKKSQPAFSFLVSACAAVVLAGTVLAELAPVLAWLQSLAGYTSAEFIGPLLKVLGIALVAQLAADLCRDAGLAAAASSAELAGRLLILLQALPLLQGLLDVFFSFLQ